jgi:hypothetical protein
LPSPASAIMPVTIPSLSQIGIISALRDPVLRNLFITQTYHELSCALRDILGFEHANWCSFATWASKQAGHTIRGEDLPAQIHRLLEDDEHYVASLERLKGALIERFEMAIVHHTHVGEHLLELMHALSAAIAEGNLKVFAELAPLFIRFIDMFTGGTIVEEPAFTQFLATLTPGDTVDGGQGLLRSAFVNYRSAAFEPVTKHKMELILTANVQIGLHEQIRLQPNIARGLDTPVEIVEGWLRRRIFDRLPFVHHDDAHELSAPHVTPLAHTLTRLWCKHATNHVMTLAMPGLVLHLGHDVPVMPGRPMFPEGLDELEHGVLIDLARAYDRSWNTTVGSGAADWTQLDDRMHYIVDLFRSRHAEDVLHEPPFDPSQVRAMREGRVPAGHL